jgi:hypothetical protein
MRNTDVRLSSSRDLRNTLIFLVILALAISIPLGSAKAYTGFPTTSIVSVEKDVSVTVQMNNLPPTQSFTVRMGKIGTKAIGGEIVKTFDSAAGGSQKMTFNIPASLKGLAQIAIRIDSPAGYYAYDWFTNSVSSTALATSPGAGTPTATKPAATATPSATKTATPAGTKTATVAATAKSGYSGIPTISILSVVKDSTVTVKTNNYPANETFTVRLGAFGTKAIGGTIVGTVESGKGGVFEATFTIPEAMKGKSLIAIRLDSTHGYYSYNWFWNYTTP